MEESLERELRRTIRKKLPLALLMVDVDHFKHFNDKFGHETGVRFCGNWPGCFSLDFEPKISPVDTEGKNLS